MRFLFFIFLTTLVFAEQSSQQPPENNLHNPFPDAQITKEGNFSEGADNNISQWTSTNWKNYFQKNGMDNSVIGNTQAMMGSGKEGQIAATADPNRMTTDALKGNVPQYRDSNLSENPAIRDGWDQSFQQQLLSSSINNQYAGVMKEGDQIKCYITRDIAFRWKCTYTGQTFGGGMNENGKKAREKCQNECYEQKNCVNLLSNPANSDLIINDITCDFSQDENCTREENLSEQVIKDLNVTFDDYNSTNSSIDNDYLIDIKLYQDEENEYYVVKNLRRSLIDDNNFIMNINKKARRIIIKLHRYADNNNTEAKIKKIAIKYKNDGKYICPVKQNLNNFNPGQFGYTCADGNIETFTVGHTEYKICNDGTYGADNTDGTFSTLESCQSYCKIASSCVPDQTITSTAALETSFREGCIEGQSNCSNDNEDCKLARIHGDKILDEVVFDATAHKKITIQNSVQVQDVRRPRIDPGEDHDYLRREQEEWKDDAFKDMAINHKYNVTSFTIGEDSNSSSSYRIGVTSGASFGVVGTAMRALYWNLKPRAFDCNNDVTYYLYAVLQAEVGYHEYNEYGELQKKRKNIWYIKVNDTDNFKPIKLALDVAISDVDENNDTVVATMESSSLEDKTFIGDNWVSLDPSQQAAYFKTIKFQDIIKPYWSFPIVYNLGNLPYMLPGLVRRIERSTTGYDQYYYTGNFDGTGDGLLTFSVVVYYSSNPLTYQDLYQKILDGEAKTIYKQGEEYLYTNDIKSDALPSNPNIKLYLYGPPNKTTVSTTIHPDKADIGKKGFIYVFIQ